MTAQIVVVLAPGFEEIEAVTPIDVLRRAELDVTIAGVGATAICGSHGISYGCDTTIEKIDGVPDAIVLPGGLPGSDNLARSNAVRDLVLAVREKGGVCAAICAAPAVAFASFGLLEGKRATCYPGLEHLFGESTTHSEERVVVDGQLVTSRGPGTALEFSLQLVAMLASESCAAELREGMLVASS